MTPDQLTKLKDGDIIRNTMGNAYTVLRNIGLVVIAAHTVEITDAAEWEHVYTTTPLCGMTNELERLGWIFNIRHCEWTSPNGSYKTKQTQTAWGQRHDFPKRSHDFKPSPEPSLVHMIKEIQTLGWTFNENIDFWTSPDGKFKTPSLRRAWGSRNNYPRPQKYKVLPRRQDGSVDFEALFREFGAAKNVNSFAEARPKTGPTVAERVEELQKLKQKAPVKSFPEAREALRQAGWVNVAGIVWRAPSGCFFDGTRCAYDAMMVGNPS